MKQRKGETMSVQKGVKVMAGIDNEILRRVGLLEVRNYGVIQAVAIHMDKGATRVAVEYIPKDKRDPFWRRIFTR